MSIQRCSCISRIWFQCFNFYPFCFLAGSPTDQTYTPRYPQQWAGKLQGWKNILGFPYTRGLAGVSVSPQEQQPLPAGRWNKCTPQPLLSVTAEGSSELRRCFGSSSSLQHAVPACCAPRSLVAPLPCSAPPSQTMGKCSAMGKAWKEQSWCDNKAEECKHALQVTLAFSLFFDKVKARKDHALSVVRLDYSLLGFFQHC